MIGPRYMCPSCEVMHIEEGFPVVGPAGRRGWACSWVCRAVTQRQWDDELAEPLSMDQSHTYTSSACLHELHPRCRLACKFCGVPCRCVCHV